jgi:hypothetical protein
MSRMPKQKPGRSKQDYGTPPEFIQAVEDRLKSNFAIDLAASHENAKAPVYITEEENSLVQDWADRLGLGVGLAQPALWTHRAVVEEGPWGFIGHEIWYWQNQLKRGE